MEVDIAVVPEHGGRAADGLAARFDDPDLLLLFPTTREVQDHGYRPVLERCEDRFDTVTGISVGAYATHDTDGFASHGTCAIALDGVSFETERFENVWTEDLDTLLEAFQGHDGTTMTFGPAGREAAGTTTWKTLKRFASHVITRDTFGQRERLIDNLWKVMKNQRIGYSQMQRAQVRASLAGGKMVNFGCSDMGRFREGYEFFNGTMTERTAGTMIHLDGTLRTGTAQSAIETLSSARILEQFDSVEAYRDIIYRFGEKTVQDLREEYGVAKGIDRASFSRYLLLETQGSIFAVPFSSDLDVVVSYITVDEDATASLVEMMDLAAYKDTFRDMLDQIPAGTPHISIHPAQVNVFGEDLFDLATVADAALDEYVITIDNAQRWRRAIDYNFPGYVVYR